MAELLTNILIGVCLLLSFLGFVMTFSDGGTNTIKEYFYISNNSNQTLINNTWWDIIGSKYLYNKSNILDVNETMLNNTITSLSGTSNGNYSQYTNITNFPINNTQFFLTDLLNFNLTWLYNFFYSETETDNLLNDKMNVTNCVSPQFVRGDGVCAIPATGGGSGNTASSSVYNRLTTNNNNNNFYSSSSASSSVYNRIYYQVSSVSNLTVNGNLNVTGNIYGNFIYGEMWNKSDASFEMVDLVNPAEYVKIHNLEAGDLNGFTSTDGNLTADVEGRYQVIAKVGAKSTAVAGEYGMKVYINEVGQNDCYDHEEPSTSPIGFIATCIVSLSVGDNLNIRFDDHANPVRDINLLNANINLIRVGD